MTKITIIIVTYNSLRLINDCLDSIFTNNDIGEGLEVMVIDNASADQKELFDQVRMHFGDRVNLFDSGENGGYGKGNNYGIAKTTSDIIIVMNPDVRFIAPVFKRICKEFENPNLGMAGVSFVDGSSPYYFKPEHGSFVHSLFIHYYLKRKVYDSEKMYMSGSLLIFKRSAFIDAGRFDENIFMYYEEPDITNRILKSGKQVKWLEDIMVLHLAHGRKYNPKLAAIQNQSFEYYCNKYGVSAKKRYISTSMVLKIKKVAAWLKRDNDRYEVFDHSLKDIKQRIKVLK